MKRMVPEVEVDLTGRPGMVEAAMRRIRRRGESGGGDVLIDGSSSLLVLSGKEERGRSSCALPSHIIAMDPNREAYEIGLPSIKKAGVEHKIEFIESPALPILDSLLEDTNNEASFDFAFVDADKDNYWNYHERLLKLIKIGGMIIYDNTLWGGMVAWPEEEVPAIKKPYREAVLSFNKAISEDCRIEIALASIEAHASLSCEDPDRLATGIEVSVFTVANVRDYDAVKRTVNEVGPIDVLLLNHGMFVALVVVVARL
ncbi:hypothetical protein PIB30_089965 [Stylosanthes scabra]|uniref:Caffeoyl-CoA O-methyltransferase n=1 Tax=Stylosanthes scabra TaxID=79078 RepID=A0ABU6SWH7_9FABA|nr:hypothetical protein [Stylosanthes scabra]